MAELRGVSSAALTRPRSRLVVHQFTMEFVERSEPAIDVFTLARIEGWPIISAVSGIL